MKLRVEEISSIIEKQIASFDQRVETRWMCVFIEPRFFIKTGGLDYKRVSLPLGHRVAIPIRPKVLKVLSCRQFSPVHPHFA